MKPLIFGLIGVLTLTACIATPPATTVAGAAAPEQIVVPASSPIAKIKIVAIGDSEIRGKGVDEEDTYPAKLEQALRARGYDVVVSNAGVDGERTQGVLDRLDRAVPSDTQIAIVSVGGNDLFQYNIGRRTVIENLQSIAKRLRARNIEVLVFAVYPANQGEIPLIRGERDSLEALGVMTMPPMQFQLSDISGMHVETSHSGPTGWHLNALGYGVVVSRTMPIIEGLIFKVKKSH